MNSHIDGGILWGVAQPNYAGLIHTSRCEGSCSDTSFQIYYVTLFEMHNFPAWKHKTDKQGVFKMFCVFFQAVQGVAKHFAELTKCHCIQPKCTYKCKELQALNTFEKLNLTYLPDRQEFYTWNIFTQSHATLFEASHYDIYEKTVYHNKQQFNAAENSCQ